MVIEEKGRGKHVRGVTIKNHISDVVIVRRRGHHVKWVVKTRIK